MIVQCLHWVVLGTSLGWVFGGKVLALAKGALAQGALTKWEMIVAMIVPIIVTKALKIMHGIVSASI